MRYGRMLYQTRLGRSGAVRRKGKEKGQGDNQPCRLKSVNKLSGDLPRTASHSGKSKEPGKKAAPQLGRL